MLTELKNETKLFHSSVEKVLIKELKELSNVEEYYALLTKLLNFYESVESKIHDLVDEKIIADIKDRTHIKHLKLDLKFNNVPYQFIENPFSARIETISYALGVLYVIEGATLGGQIITNMLKKQLLTNEEQPIFNYFNSYGERTHEMWANMKSNLENSNYNINKEELTQGAKDTFSELEKWLLKY